MSTFVPNKISTPFLLKDNGEAFVLQGKFNSFLDLQPPSILARPITKFKSQWNRARDVLVYKMRKGTVN